MKYEQFVIWLDFEVQTSKQVNFSLFHNAHALNFSGDLFSSRLFIQKGHLKIVVNLLLGSSMDT